MDSIPTYTISPKQVLGRVTTMIGGSGLGKTTIVRHFLHTIRSQVEQAFLISKTAAATRDFEGLIPDACIHSELNINFLQLLFDRQTALRDAYDRINAPEVIDSLYTKCDHSGTDRLINNILAQIESNIASLEENKENEDTIKKIREDCDYLVTGIKKKTINANRAALSSMRLTPEESYSLENLNLNPNIVLIFDDCTTEIEKMRNHKLIKDLFFLGRHKFITTLMILHTDKAIGSELKKSAAFTIFVDRPSATVFLERSTTGLSRATKKKLTEEVEKIIGTPDDPEPKRWQRAVFANNKLYKFTAQVHEREPFFNKYLLGFIETITERSKVKLSSKNKFAKLYEA